MQNKIILSLSLPLTALVIIVSCIGLFTPGFYSAETTNWQAQSTGQDMIDLFLIAPCLLITSILIYRNNKTSTMIWGGVVLYLTYTYALYCFDVHFNKLFMLYCLCLGLSFYSLAYYLVTPHKINEASFKNNSAIRFTGIYFILVAVLFYFLWLSEIIPATLHNSIPKSVSDAGLLTNGVQVLDLSVILPLIFLTGIFLFKRIFFGFVLAPIILSFFILMDITIGLLAVVMKIKGIEVDLMVTGIIIVFAFISLVLLIWFLKSIKINTSP